MEFIPKAQWLIVSCAIGSLLALSMACPRGEQERDAPTPAIARQPLAARSAPETVPEANDHIPNTMTHNQPTSLTQPVAAPPDPTALADGINQMGFNLQKRLAEVPGGKNLFVSPASISLALAMTWEGTEGPTREAMTSALGLGSIPAPQVGPAFEELMKRLMPPDERIQIRVANSLWARSDVGFRQEYLDRVKAAYSAMVSTLDFNDMASPERINQWVDRQTEGRIPKIVDRIPSDAILYLINAIWFKGTWTHTFDPALTRPQPFHLSGQSVREHPLMRRMGEWEYREGEGMQMAGLPYGKGSMRMIVILPGPETGLAALMQRLDWPTLKGWLEQMNRREGQLALPKFKMEYEADLRDPLTAMGMGLAFSDAADFSGMVMPPTRAAISEVKHKTFVEVNERGTEAAAVTSVQMRATRAREPQPPFRMIVDRPFFCAIQDRRTGVLLFMGAIHEPNL